MIKPGICSITFRQKTPEEIIALSLEAGLSGIEWGADVHVPPNDLANARRIGELTRDAGLDVACYGSYYMARENEGDEEEPFEPILKAAVALDAPVIRIWGGSLSVSKNDAYFETVVQRSRDAADMAAGEGVKVAFEHHQHTYTETLDGLLSLLAAVDHPNLYTFWQPPHGSGLQQRLDEIAAVGNRLLNLHVFHWEPATEPPYTRLPLGDGAELWKPILSAAGTEDRYAMLEFVQNDDPAQFMKDADTLLGWIKQ